MSSFDCWLHIIINNLLTIKSNNKHWRHHRPNLNQSTRNINNHKVHRRNRRDLVWSNELEIFQFRNSPIKLLITMLKHHDNVTGKWNQLVSHHHLSNKHSFNGNRNDAKFGSRMALLLEMKVIIIFANSRLIFHAAIHSKIASTGVICGARYQCTDWRHIADLVWLQEKVDGIEF